MAQLAAIVGPHNTELCPTLIQLTLADSAYSMLTTPTDSEKVRVEVEG